MTGNTRILYANMRNVYFSTMFFARLHSADCERAGHIEAE